jgi:hypothetical protein
MTAINSISSTKTMFQPAATATSPAGNTQQTQPQAGVKKAGHHHGHHGHHAAAPTTDPTTDPTATPTSSSLLDVIA